MAETLRFLNLGSGPGKADGWLNVDVFPDSEPDVAADAMHLPFEDGAFGRTYVGNVLEYVHKEHALALLKEVRRVTAKVVLVVFPDVRRVLSMAARRAFDVEGFHEAVYGQDAHPFDRQLWLPDAATVAATMAKAGFFEVEAIPRATPGRGWPSYPAKPWETAIRAHGSKLGHDGGRQDQEPRRTPPMVAERNDTLEKALEAGYSVTRNIEGGQYVATVRKGTKVGVGRADTLDQAIKAGIDNLTEGGPAEPDADPDGAKAATAKAGK